LVPAARVHPTVPSALTNTFAKSVLPVISLKAMVLVVPVASTVFPALTTRGASLLVVHQAISSTRTHKDMARAQKNVCPLVKFAMIQ